MPLPKKSNRPCFLIVLPWLAGILLITLVCPFLSDPACAAGKSPSEATPQELKQREQRLWQEAVRLQAGGEDREAAEAFSRYYRGYPDSPRAEDALWKSANLYRELAISGSEPDWEKAQELYRDFTIDYPQSSHLADAYFEVANAYDQMHLSREALAYLGLFIERFPDSPRAGEALEVKAGILMKIGRLREAAEAYRRLAAASDEVARLRGQAGLGHIAFANHKYHEALAIYRQILKQWPAFYDDDPELLRNLGLANIRVGNLEEGRRELLQYLNIAGENESRPETLFELAESYLASGQPQTARQLYELVIAEGEGHEREVGLSRMRLALMGHPGKEDTAPDGDKVLLEVLDRQPNDHYSQVARFALVKRYWDRKEYGRAFELGKTYLHYETTEAEKKEVAEILGQILIIRMEKLFQEKSYDAVYQLYREDYPYVKMYRGGRLLYLTGLALEEMGLYRQAGIIYDKAMGLELTDDEQLELNMHRVQCSLADHDFTAANRLLKKLRKLYAAKPAMGEICFLSGQLRERQNRGGDALHFYQMAVESAASPEQKGNYAANYLRLLFAQDQILEEAQVLDTFKKEKWLAPQELQKWYGKLAERYRRNKDPEKAADAYFAALADDLPQDNATAQQLRLELGDVLLFLGKGKEALLYFRKAVEGPDELIRKMALQRVNQENIDRAMADTKAVWKK